jgi:predicted RNA-binding protein with RPS1 domain
VQEGSVHKVRVVKLMDYGAFVELPNGFQALLHVSELEHERVRCSFVQSLILWLST